MRFMAIRRRLQTLLALAILLLLPSYSPCQDELADPLAIFHAHYEAVGGLARLKALSTSYSEGLTRHDGLHGTFRSWGKRPVEYRLEEDYQVMNQTTGDDGHFSWLQDANNRVLVFRDEETMKRREVAARFEQFEHLEQPPGHFSLFFEGMEEVQGRSCYKVRVENSINSDISWFYFDRQTFYVLKQVTKQPDYESHVLLSDHREVQGFVVPFQTDTRILPRDKTESTTVTLYQPHATVDEKLFAIPPQRRDDFAFRQDKKSETIPFDFIEKNIYLPVVIQGESRPWLLDSGASTSIIDADYARQLGLKPEGEVRGFGFGETFALGVVNLPGYQVGSVRFKDQKIFAYEGLSASSYEPRIAGILGYDFLSRLITKIDYGKRLISFYHPDHFHYSGPGKVIDAPLKYHSFSVPVTLNGRQPGRWGLDLGAEDSSIFYQFAQKHGYDKQPGILRASRGLQSAYLERSIRVNEVNIAGYSLLKQRIDVPLDAGKGANAVGELAGNLGNSLLQHFTLILDYDRQQLILEKGAQFGQTLPEDKSGILVGMSPDDGQPMVSYVAPETPAETAGFVAGDLILSIDGVAVADYGGVVPVRDLLRQPSGTRHQFVVERQGEQLGLTLVLADLL